LASVMDVLVELRGNGIGDTASAPNWASKNMRRRDRRVEGSGVFRGLGCLNRWDNFWVVMSSAS
jgi:hypothetical protein